MAGAWWFCGGKSLSLMMMITQKAYPSESAKRPVVAMEFHTVSIVRTLRRPAESHVLLRALLVATCILASTVQPIRGEIGLGNLAVGLGLNVREISDNRFITENRFSSITWENNNRRILFNGIIMHLNAVPQRRGGVWYISDSDAYLLPALLAPTRFLSHHRCETVIIDPGHGGEYPGASGFGGVSEKKLTLDIARRVRDRLRDTGLMVYLTRDRDRGFSSDRNKDLIERSRRADYYRADLFVSIHFNASGDHTATGLETYVAPATGHPATAQLVLRQRRISNRTITNQFDAASTILAQYVQKGIVAFAKSVDRGIKRANFMVLQNAPCPAILVECGFLSNRQECERILSENFRNALADGIAAGILTYASRAREGRFSLLPRPTPATLPMTAAK